ncbi:MAG: hypothetical protein II588_04595 [Paludibacteraceae bacterium]|nr:hypothetical protein [Paludibacteraceae bacterium]
MSFFFRNFAADMKEILIVIGMVGVSILLLAVGVILRRDHRFRSEHIAQNRRMRRDGIHCATSQDREARRQVQKKIQVKKL